MSGEPSEIRGRGDLPDLQPARIEWRDGAPLSSTHGDVYFSRDGGADECRHVFLDGNGLPGRWRGRRSFTIGETGFGTGLNFLVAWDLWRRQAAPGATLHYVSVELHPLTDSELARAHSAVPRLAELSARLRRALPPPISGFHRRVFAGVRGEMVRLNLLQGEAGVLLRSLEARVDAWFLDGFAPDRNSDLWEPRLLAEVARCSAPGATLATYTVAGAVRRALHDAGFDIEKVPGFGRKRECLRGRSRGQATPQTRGAGIPSRVLVVGAGLAGATVARALAERGVSVVVVDRHSEPAGEGSGNAVGLFREGLARSCSARERFRTAGAGVLADLLTRTPAAPSEVCGALEVPASPGRRALFEDLRERRLPPSVMRTVNAHEASALAGAPIPHTALHYPRGGWASPRDLCRELLQGIEFSGGTEVASLERRAGEWIARDDRGRALAGAPHIVLACAGCCLELLRSADLREVAPPLRALRGQVTEVPPADGLGPRLALHFGGYLTPAVGGLCTVGATFGRDDLDIRVRAADHGANLRRLFEELPALARRFFPRLERAGITLSESDAPPLAEAPGRSATPTLSGRAGLRWVTPDAWPVVGEVRPPSAPGTPAPDTAVGIWLSLAHGAHGLTSAPIAAELIAAQLCGEPWPLERQIVARLHPGRFSGSRKSSRSRRRRRP